MTVWTPVNQGQITSADPLGGKSCVSYSYAFAISDATNGRLHPTGAEVRRWTGDDEGGLELGQCDRAVSKMIGLDFNTQVFTKAEFDAHRAAGDGAVLIGGYRPIEATDFSGQADFVKNHGVYVPPDLRVMDPLADGRHRSWGTAYKYHGEVYPESLIDAFAAALLVGPEGKKHPVGPDHFEASFIHLEAAPVPAPRYRLSMTTGAWWMYDVKDRVIHDRIRAHTGGFSGICTASVRCTWPGIGDYRLVRMLTGSRGDAALGKGKGRWIAAKAAHTTITEVMT